MFDRALVSDLKLAVALLAAALLVADLLLERAGRARLLRRLRDVLLATVGLVAALCWFEGFRFLHESRQPSLRWVNFTDSFHYVMGPKYFRELGYTGLYECAAAAEFALGSGADVARRSYRDLATNEYVPGRTLLRDSSRCGARFTPARWQDFVRDIDFFRHRIPSWETTMQDWGYNATPAWNLLGTLVAGSGTLTEARVAFATLLDVPCLILMWGCVAWAFGWRTACVGLAFWGSNLWSGWNWTGGSVLRQEWLVASAVGVCLLRKRKLVAAGAAITYAALLSIFPGFLAAGVGLKAIAGWWSERRVALSSEHRRLLLGAGLALAVVLPAAALCGGGPSAWLAFVANSRIDSQPSTNNVGLPMLLSFDGDTLRMRELTDPRPVEQWMQARRQTLAARTPWLAAAALGFVALLTAAVRREPDWVAAILGLGFVVVAFQLSNYYYAFLLLYALLWPRHRGVGIALCAVALATHWLVGRWPDEEEYCTWSSALAVAFVLFATAAVALARSGPAGEAARGARPLGHA